MVEACLEGGESIETARSAEYKAGLIRLNVLALDYDGTIAVGAAVGPRI
jgi:hypothetical protein